MNLKNYRPKHIVNLSKEKATINLFSEIGGESGIGGQAFADEIQMLNEFGVEEINIHIVSPGGSVLDGQAIFTSIINSEAHVTTHIDGAAASMAAIIALAGHTVKMSDRGSLMIHDPHTGGPEPDENALKALAALRESLLVILERRSELTRAKLSKIMDQETWILPAQALEDGMVDEVVKTKKAQRQTAKAIMEIFNSYSNINNKQSDMKEIAKHLGLNEEAPESSIVDAIKAIETKLEKADTDLNTANESLTVESKKVTELEAKVAVFENAEKAAAAKLLEDTVQKGIDSGVLEADKKEDIVAKFAGNLEGLQLITGSIKTSAVDIIGSLKVDAPVVAEADLPEDIKGKSWRELQKNNQKGLDALKVSNMKAWNAIYFAKYQKNHPDFVEEAV